MSVVFRKHSRRPAKARVGRTVWVEPDSLVVPCQTLTRLSLVKHAKSDPHHLALQMKADLCSSKKDGGIAMALERVVSAERKACWCTEVYVVVFLNYQVIAHTTKFVPLVELCKSLGASYLSDLRVGPNARYACEPCVQEFLQCLDETVAESFSSHEKAVSHLHKTFPSTIVSLEREAHVQKLRGLFHSLNLLLHYIYFWLFCHTWRVCHEN